MHKRFGKYVMVLVLAAFMGGLVAAPAQAFTGVYAIQNAASNWCLEGYGGSSPSLATTDEDVSSTTGLCKSTAFDRWTFQDVTVNPCLPGYCGDLAYHIHVYPHVSGTTDYCLSQNNAGSAYLTPCTGNDYQTWLVDPHLLFTYLINYASRVSSTTWCLSSNLTPPPGFLSDFGSVYTTAYTTNNFHYWAFDVLS